MSSSPAVGDLVRLTPSAHSSTLSHHKIYTVRRSWVTLSDPRVVLDVLPYDYPSTMFEVVAKANERDVMEQQEAFVDRIRKRLMGTEFSMPEISIETAVKLQGYGDQVFKTPQVKPYDQSNKLRVWWIPQVPMKPFIVPVRTLREGKLLLDTLAKYDAFQLENNIKPDYSNVGGLSVLDDDGEWTDWMDDEGRDIDDTELPEAQ